MKDLFWCLVAVFVLLGVACMIFNAINTPEVEFSWSTKQCVRVVYMDGKTTDCSSLPEKYDHVWVK
jgi:hypothetical protein